MERSGSDRSGDQLAGGRGGQPATGDAERLLAGVRATGLLARGAPLIVLCSGGRDSVCLLDVAVAICGPASVLALHVNYGLRDAAAGDERHCAALCESLGVALERSHPRRPAGSGNLQAWARAMRYGLATRLALERGAHVATGHTATDQVETVLYRLAASPGRRALLGLAPSDGLLVRPLLGVTREDTAAYCTQRGLTWRDDASNESDAYARNRVRRQLVPRLREIHPAAEANVARTAQLLRDEAAVLDEVTSTALAGRDRIALERLAELPTALARLIVVRLAEDAAGRLVPEAGSRLAELLGLAKASGSASLDLGHGVRGVVEYGVLRMAAVPDPEPPPSVRLRIPGRARFGAWELSGEPCAPDALSHAAPSRASRRDSPPPATSSVLDAAALRDELVVRSWRAGDRVAPLGLGGTKTLADLFTDRRVPRAQRPTLPVVESGGLVAWVPGVAVSEHFRISDATERAVRLSASVADGT